MEEKLKKIITKDDSITFLNTELNETYHSITGAREESIKKYIEPLKEILSKDKIRVIDFCFGLGYNTLSLIEKSNKNSKIEIHTIEKDIEIIKQIQNLNLNSKYEEEFKEKINEITKEHNRKDYETQATDNSRANIKIDISKSGWGLSLTGMPDNNILPIDFASPSVVYEVKSFISEHNTKKYKFYLDNKRIEIQLYIDDARKVIPKLKKEYFDAVLFDPFSPKKQPELWTSDIFKTLYNLLKDNGKLTTYSCAGWIRRNMKEANFFIQDGPKVHRRSPSTIAIKRIQKYINNSTNS